MDELVGYVILAVIGWVVGAAIGHFTDGSISPDCWYGMCAGLGIMIIPHIGDCH